MHRTDTTMYEEGSEIGPIPNDVPWEPSYTFNYFTLSSDPSFVAYSSWMPGPDYGDLTFQANWTSNMPDPNGGGGFGGGGYCDPGMPWDPCSQP